ncbi:unnamed protein product [Vicia faba]|uniref:Uncharacterized protein n=1 Tax=Vicia faba TaxID=3906 RepID=A0AAV0YMH2_VICFA|nr:unnamed protein product [Vicia faba]
METTSSAFISSNTVPDSSVAGTLYGFNEEAIPEAKDVVRVDLVGGFALQKCTSERSYFRTIANMDVKVDFVPPSLINFISRQLIGNGFRLYQKVVASVMSQDKEEFSKALGDPLYARIREALYSASSGELPQVARIHPAEDLVESKKGEVKDANNDDAAWHAAVSEDEDAGETSNYGFGQECLDRLLPLRPQGFQSHNLRATITLDQQEAVQPSSPIPRSTSSTRPSTPTSRTTPSRASTPSRIRTVSTSSTAEKPRPISQSSRPSTPSSRPQVPANLHSPSAPSTRSLSRPSTPTRRSSIPSLSPSSATSSSTSAGRVPLNGRSSAPSSQPSSPSPRIWAPPQPVVPPDFPLDTPPNLRTTLPDRPVSAGRSRPGVNTLKGNTSETQASVNMPRRASSPIVSRGRSTEPVSKSRGFANGNGHHADVHEPRKVSHAPEVAARRSVKASTNTTDNSGFGRNISKKSLDMAIKHMDIRNGSGNHRALSSTTLFPQSIRNSTPKSQYNRGSSAPPTSIEANGNILNKNNGSHFDVVNGINRNMIKVREIDERQYSAKLSEIDVYESSRYDALLLKEDLKNTNWLHSVDDKFDQGSLLFDNGFENLPEPFGLL